MSTASEKCGCGASVDITLDHQHHVREALAEWRKDHHHAAPSGKEESKPAAATEHHREGNNFSATERRGPHSEPYELHGQYRPDSYGQISLKWHPQEDAR